MFILENPIKIADLGDFRKPPNGHFNVKKPGKTLHYPLGIFRAMFDCQRAHSQAHVQRIKFRRVGLFSWTQQPGSGRLAIRPPDQKMVPENEVDPTRGNSWGTR